MKKVSKPMRSLFTGLILTLLAFVPVAFCWKQIRVRDKLIYATLEHRFKEPIEIMYLITSDFTMYKITSNDEIYINFRMSDLKRMLEKNNHTISDILAIIHNHLLHGGGGFSQNDVNTWREFKREGFTGNFYLYYTGNKTIYELIENDDDDS